MRRSTRRTPAIALTQRARQAVSNDSCAHACCAPMRNAYPKGAARSLCGRASQRLGTLARETAGMPPQLRPMSIPRCPHHHPSIGVMEKSFNSNGPAISSDKHVNAHIHRSTHRGEHTCSHQCSRRGALGHAKSAAPHTFCCEFIKPDLDIDHAGFVSD